MEIPEECKEIILNTKTSHGVIVGGWIEPCDNNKLIGLRIDNKIFYGDKINDTSTYWKYFNKPENKKYISAHYKYRSRWRVNNFGSLAVIAARVVIDYNIVQTNKVYYYIRNDYLSECYDDIEVFIRRFNYVRLYVDDIKVSRSENTGVVSTNPNLIFGVPAVILLIKKVNYLASYLDAKSILRLVMCCKKTYNEYKNMIFIYLSLHGIELYPSLSLKDYIYVFGAIGNPVKLKSPYVYYKY